MAILGEVTFELQHFRAFDGALRIVGRWHGIRVRGSDRPVLTVTIAGEDQRLNVLPGEHDDAGDGRWFAAFAWRGDPRSITAAELQVGRRVVVTLPPPHCPRGRRRDYVATRRSDMQALESGLAAAREDEHSRAAVQALPERLASTRGEASGAPTRGGRRSSRGLWLSVERAPMAALRGVRRGIARAEVGMFLLVLVLDFAVAWLVVHLP